MRKICHNVRDDRSRLHVDGFGMAVLVIQPTRLSNAIQFVDQPVRERVKILSRPSVTAADRHREKS